MKTQVVVAVKREVAEDRRDRLGVMSATIRTAVSCIVWGFGERTICTSDV